MIFLAFMALGAGLTRLAAPHIRNIVASHELKKPGLVYVEAAKKVYPIDGAWTPEELPAVMEALNGGDRRILEIGAERIEALIRAGCPVCANKDCRKLFPGGSPSICDRCGHKIEPLK